MVRKFISIGLVFLLSLANVASAQDQRVANFSYLWDLDSETVSYCKVVGQGGSPFGGAIQGVGTVTSTSTAVEASDSTAFLSLGAGDIFLAVQSEGLTILQVASVTDGNSLTLVAAPASDFAAVPWRWLDQQCGTGATNGWIDVSNMEGKTFTIQYEQGDGNIDVRWECKKSYLGAQPMVVYPSQATDPCGTNGTLTSGYCRYTAANVGIANRISLVEWAPYKECRVGVKLTAADSSDATTDLEQITIGLENTLRR